MTATNHLGFDERLKQGKKREAEVIDLLKKHVLEVEGKKRLFVIPASEQDDIKRKIDAWFHLEDGTKRSIQIKFRDIGEDLGVALIRPYNHMLFRMDVAAGTERWDRDMKCQADYIACLANYGKELILVPTATVKKAAELLLAQLSKIEDFSGRVFSDPKMWGAELRVVRDRGGGYSEGQEKIVMYMNQRLIEAAGGRVIKVA